MRLDELQLKTTTRPNRHVREFQDARALLAAPASGRPLEIANIGPGLAVKYLGRLAAEDMPGWNLVKRLESGVRRVPMPDAWYENYESHELIAALQGLPFNLTVIDINPKVVRVIAKEVRGRSVATAVADLGEENPSALVPLRQKFDFVVALTVIGRMKESLFDTARKNIVSLVKPGGLLLASGGFREYGCAPVEGQPNMYRRT